MIRCYRSRVAPAVQKEIASFFAWVRRNVVIRHPIRVKVLPCHALTDDELRSDLICLGAIYLPESRRWEPTDDDPALPMDIAGKHPSGRVVFTAAHELGHYVQWREGLDTDNEDEANSMARTFVKEWRRGR